MLFKYLDRKVYVAFLMFFALLLSFQFNLFNAAPKSFFDGHQRDSESLVIGRIIETGKNGYFSSGGFLGRYQNNTFFEFQYSAYEKSEVPSSEFFPYRQSIGLQGFFYSATDAVFRYVGIESGELRLFLNKLLNSTLFSLVLLVFSWFVYKNYGLVTAVITAVLVSISQWLVVFSNNLYWMFFLVLLPFIVVTCFFQLNYNSKKSLGLLCGFVFLSVLIKCLAGYEYISTVLVSTLVPVVFFSVKNAWKVYFFLVRFFLVGLSGLLGFFAAIVIHIFQLSALMGSYSSALAHIWVTMTKRTHGDPKTHSEAFVKSLESNIGDVLLKYWNGSAFSLESLFGFSWNITFGEVIIALAVITVVGFLLTFSLKSLRALKRLNMASALALWFSILAPISWHVLAKGHSYVHVHMNHVLWYVPFLLLGFSYGGFVVVLMVRSFLSLKWRCKLLVLLAFIFLVTSVVLTKIHVQNSRSQEYIGTIRKLSALSSSNLTLYQDGENLVYQAESCNEALGARFFLHLYPLSPKYLPKENYRPDFMNLDFYWADKESHISYDFIFKKSCLASVKLTQYPLMGIRTGQFIKQDRLWQDYIDLTRSRFIKVFSAYDLTDSNWERGVSRRNASLFVANNFDNRQSLKVGDNILFPKARVRVIESIEYSERYINIYISGGLLDSKLDGYPAKFSLID